MQNKTVKEHNCNHQNLGIMRMKPFIYLSIIAIFSFAANTFADFRGELSEAIKDNDRQAVRQLYEKGYDFEFAFEDPYTGFSSSPLQKAMLFHQIDLFEDLITYSVPYQCSENLILMMLYCNDGEKGMPHLTVTERLYWLQRLLQLGISPHQLPRDSYIGYCRKGSSWRKRVSPFELALTLKDLESMDLFRKSPFFEGDKRLSTGETALSQLALASDWDRADRRKMMAMIIEASDQDVFAANASNWTALQILIQQKEWQDAQWLIAQGSPVQRQGVFENASLSLSLKNENGNQDFSFSQFLLEQGFDINLSNVAWDDLQKIHQMHLQLYSPLVFAAKNKLQHAVSWLLQQNIDHNLQLHWALINALWQHDYNIANILLLAMFEKQLQSLIRPCIKSRMHSEIVASIWINFIGV